MITTKINGNISYFTTSYKDIFTTVYVIKTQKGVLLFDTASFDIDVNESILPAFDELGIGKEELKYVFISHAHKDHAGGLAKLLTYFPSVTVISKSAKLRETYPDTAFVDPSDGDVFLDVLKVVTIPGHTSDSAAILDLRDKFLISGDCLQLYGIFGSGAWGANISLPTKHREALNKLRRMDIDGIFTAHDYHPFGQRYLGKENVQAAIDACEAPLLKVAELIRENPALSDEEITAIYNSEKLPTLGAHVVTAVRNGK